MTLSALSEYLVIKKDSASAKRTLTTLAATSARRASITSQSVRSATVILLELSNLSQVRCHSTNHKTKQLNFLTRMNRQVLLLYNILMCFCLLRIITQRKSESRSKWTCATPTLKHEVTFPPLLWRMSNSSAEYGVEICFFAYT